MKEHRCDVAIIGSGLGGLSSGALLARAGFKVLVMEKLPFLGGRASTVELKGFRLPTGVAFVCDEVIGEVCREVGAPVELLIPHPQAMVRFQGKDYDWPEGGGSLRKLITYACQNEVETGKIMGGIRRALGWQLPSNAISLKDWFLQYTSNPRVLGLFNAFLAMYGGIRISECPAGEFFLNMKETGQFKNWGPAVGGTVQVAENLARVIRNTGGDVWTRTTVKQILVKDALVTGLVAEKEGQEIRVSCQAVISNAGPKATVELVGKDVVHSLDGGYLREVAEKDRSAPQLILFIASDRPLMEFRGALFLPEGRRVFSAMNTSAIDPEVAPKGKHLMEVATFITSSMPPYDMKKEIELSILDIRDNFPDFEKHGEVLLASAFHSDWPLMRCWPGEQLPPKTPVVNLYNVGDAVAPPGWWTGIGAAKSGRLVAEDVERRLKPESRG